MDKKQELLRKIAELFYENGYEKTSIRDISRALGMTNAGLYYYFENKQEMLFEIMDGAIEDALVSIRREIGKIESAEDKIAWIIQAHIKFYCENKAQTKVLVYEKASLEAKYSEIIKGKESEYIELMRQVLGQIIQGNFQVSIPINVATFSLLGMLNWVVHWFKPEGKVSPDELADYITTIFLNGLKGKSDRAVETLPMED